MSSPFKVRSASWPRVSALLDEAVELAPAERAAFVERIAASEPETAAEVRRLLPSVLAASGEPAADGMAMGAYATLLGEALLADAGGPPGSRAAADARFGPWTLIAPLGTGGMGEVWRATRSDGLFQGAAAIKLLRSDLPAERLAARFARERAMLARLNHPNIARLLDAGIANEQAFIVLELVDGEPLLVYAAAHAPTLAARVRLIRDVARAVEHAHSQLVLHRDLKPSNVLVAGDGTVKLLDFGIASALDESGDTTPSNLTQLTGRGLTLEYAAPEQIVGDATVAASDVYSLGAMLFHLATGQRPFAASANRAALEYAVVHDDAPRASASVLADPQSARARDAIAAPADSRALRGDLDAIIAKALRKAPAERYATASAFAADLDAWLRHAPISIRAEDRSYRTRLWLRRNWALAALGGVAAAAVIVGLGVSLWQRGEAVAAAQRATAAATLAKEEAARATKVADYLGELIQSASPDQHKGSWPTVLALLEQSEKELDDKFKDDPRTRLLLLERMADTNNALNRDTVALAQYGKLLKDIEGMGEANSERGVDVRKNYASMLARLGRYVDAEREYERLDPLIRARYGERSAEYGAFLQSKGIQVANSGRIDEAKALLARGSALLVSLFPDDVPKRMGLANDAAVMYSRMDMWREAEAALAGNEKDLAMLATQGGKDARDALIQRNNLEAIRIRLGKYEGADERLRSNGDAALKLVGGPNPIAALSDELRSTVLSATGRFEASVQMVRARAESNRQLKGGDPANRIEDDLVVMRDAAIYTRIARTDLPTGLAFTRADLERLVASIATDLPPPGDRASNLYRVATDVAIAMEQYDIAREALSKAREAARRTGVGSPERLAQIERAEGALAYYTGDARKAVRLLEPRFAVYRDRREDATPRLGALWIQRGLYECSFDAAAAAESARQSRAVFARAGSTPPQFAALLAWIDGCGAADASRRAAEDAVDAAFVRARPTPWRPPFLSSL